MNFTFSNTRANTLFKQIDHSRKRYFPGLCVSITIGIAALFIAQRYGAPVMLMALLLGMAFNFLAHDTQCSPGIELSAKTLLRTGVALLGLRISLGDVTTLGWPPIIMVAGSITATILFGILISRLLGFSSKFGMLTGGSVAICGASAAMAISCVLPQNEDNQRDTLFTVVAVTSLSTIAMIVYPLITGELDLESQQAGMFLGGTIHDVAQVVGAGYSMSDEIGSLSTFVKLLRVAMLVPVVLVIGMCVRQTASSIESNQKNGVIIPAFLIGFVILFSLNSLSIVPQVVTDSATNLSSFLLVTAIAALGVRTSMQAMLEIGWRPMILVLVETIFIAVSVLAFILYYT